MPHTYPLLRSLSPFKPSCRAKAQRSNNPRFRPTDASGSRGARQESSNARGTSPTSRRESRGGFRAAPGTTKARATRAFVRSGDRIRTCERPAPSRSDLGAAVQIQRSTAGSSRSQWASVALNLFPGLIPVARGRARRRVPRRDRHHPARAHVQRRYARGTAARSGSCRATATRGCATARKEYTRRSSIC